MLPLKEQLRQVFNRLCRKAFDVSLRNNVHRLPNSTTFVVPIANELYQHYYASEFRFTDKGITPQRIANDLLIHYEPCDEVEVEVDAFGAINVWPTQRYHERCLAEIVDNENYGYLPIGNWKIQPKGQAIIVYPLQNGLTIGGYRIIHYLESIARKIQLTRQASKVVKVIVTEQQMSSELALLQRFSLINRRQQDQIIIQQDDKNNQFREYFNNQQQQNIYKIFHGCQRHNVLELQILLKQWFYNSQIISIGSVFPVIKLQKLIDSTDSKEVLLDLQKYFMKYSSRNCINFAAKEEWFLQGNNVASTVEILMLDLQEQLYDNRLELAAATAIKIGQLVGTSSPLSRIISSCMSNMILHY